METKRMESSEILVLHEDVRLYPYLDTFPKIEPSVFLCPGVKIIGDVTIGKKASVWYNTVIRGDVHYIKIGDYTNVQDCSMLHVTNGEFPLNIGSNVTIGHSVTLHGCTLQDYCFIGIGAIVLDGAVVEKHAMVAAGALVRPGFIVPSGKLVGGVPAKVIRDLTPAEIENITASAERYAKYAQLSHESLLSRAQPGK